MTFCPRDVRKVNTFTDNNNINICVNFMPPLRAVYEKMYLCL